MMKSFRFKRFPCGAQVALARRQAADADGRAEAATGDLARLRKALLDAEMEMQTLTQRLGERDREHAEIAGALDAAASRAQSAEVRQADLTATVDELEKRLASERTKVWLETSCARVVFNQHIDDMTPMVSDSAASAVAHLAFVPMCQWQFVLARLARARFREAVLMWCSVAACGMRRVSTVLVGLTCSELPVGSFPRCGGARQDVAVDQGPRECSCGGGGSPG